MRTVLNLVAFVWLVFAVFLSGCTSQFPMGQLGVGFRVVSTPVDPATRQLDVAAPTPPPSPSQ